MSTDRFDLYFRGELLDGYFADFVKVDMARLFKVDLARIEPFFSGEPQVVKLNVDRPTANKYQQALEGIGATLVVVSHGSVVSPKAQDSAGDQPAPAPVQPATTESEDAFSSTAGDWRLLPPGSVLGEHRNVQPVSVDISGLSIAEVGVDLVENAVRPPPVQVDTSQLQLDEPGVVLVEADATEPPPAPDTSHIKLVN